MVQSSNALREPSMDEILTSIREIIEENAVQADHFVNETLADASSEKHSEVSSEDVCETTLSVDDAMKALADRIGFSSDNQDFSLSQVQDNTNVEDNTVSMSVQATKLSSEEQASVHKTKQYNTKAFVSQQENTVSDCIELSPYFISSAERMAEDILRPAIAEWLQRQLPVFVEKILREEIVKTIKKLP
ncbi:DUF2497 domain-containing protein [Bartonella schoenbuchensis]|uniref:Cell pole-organizing protein PopZ n=2 Tax=Bartonella schoenbuchensis TaxID=165694 RepID=E6YZZ7_BARSR|nr:DUF2497 domain-containing protein [Bartonella schoenbuchensis]AQX30899.1 Cell pole-organizing protein PopZ [Bartonella schoenbuchensis R1]CBI82435.1 conserved hypothetical protein [Bartonella schoenbuchensis R1]CDP80261.1 hypothetical protein BN1046_01180 [Bartonella schoenbuchensis]